MAPVLELQVVWVDSRLQSGFEIGEWTAHPQENRLQGEAGDRDLEPKVMDLLVFLAGRPGQVVSRQEILDTVWAGTVVGEETLSRAVSLLRKNLDDDPRNPRYLKTISKRGYECIATITPLDGAGRASSSRHGTDSGPPARWKPLWIAIAILLVAGLATVWLRSGDSDAPPRILTDGPSIAVLPFVNRSADEADAFFVDGIHDDLLSHIARIGSIKTISSTSVRQYRGTTRTIPEIAEELGVTTILEGGVQRSGDQVRINVQLIDARTDEHLWAEIYDRQLTATNLFQIQSEIATAIAAALEATLTSGERRRVNTIPTRNLAALEAYFLGKQSLERRTTAELTRAVEHFQAAIGHDPDFALAYVGLADTHRLQSSYGVLSQIEADAKGQVAVERALQLDDQLAEAQTSLANLMRRSGEFEAAEAAFQRALALKPGYASAYHWYGEFLAIEVGRPLEAIEFTRHALELDPLSPIVNSNHGKVLDVAGRFDEALAFYDRALEIDPGFSVAHAQAGALLWYGFGRIDEAVSRYLTSIALDPGSPYIPAVLGMAFLDLGDERLAREWIEHGFSLAPENRLANSALTLLHLYQNDVPGAAEYATRTVAFYPMSRYAMCVLRDADLAAGRGAEARARYEQGFPRLAEAEPVIHALNFEAAVDLAWLLSRIGDTRRAALLLARTEDYIRDKPRMGYRGFWITDVKIHTQRGQIEQALAALRQAVDAGWRAYWWFYLEHDSGLAALHGEPGIAELKETLRRDLEGQLDRVRRAGEDRSP